MLEISGFFVLQALLVALGAVPGWMLAVRGRATLAFRLVALVAALGLWLMWKATTIPGSGGWMHFVGYVACVEVALAGLVATWVGRRVWRRREAKGQP